MKFQFALSALFLSATLTLAAPNAHAVTFSASGGRILKDGQTFVVKGVNVPGLNWVENREMTQDAALLADVWKFNTIRLNNLIKVTNQPYQQYTTNNDLNRIVDTYTAKGVVVIMCVQGLIGKYANGTTSPTIDEVSTHWKDLANRYKNNPYVWFDLQNEPGNQTWPENNGADWVNLHQRLIKDVRDQGSNNLILVEGVSWGQEGGNWDANSPSDSASAILSYGNQLLSFGGKSYSNIVFSLHLYEKWGYAGDSSDPGFSSDSKIAGYLQKISAKGYPFIVGEYGSFNNRNTMRATESMFKALQTYPDVGRIVWQWHGGDNNDLTNWDPYFSWAGAGWGTDKTDGTKPTNLSPLGSLVWDDNHEVPSGVDLIVTNVGVNQTSWSVGNTITFKITVKNNGGTSTNASWLGNLFYVDGTYVAWGGQNATLQPGQSATFTSSGWTATKTSFSLQGIADFPNYYPETNENNNSLTKTVTSGNAS